MKTDDSDSREPFDGSDLRARADGSDFATDLCDLAGLSNLAGLVLCGGESRRMGSDKGLLRKDGIPWAVNMGYKLTPWQLPVFYSINARQKTEYEVILPHKQLITDALGLSGPLEGLLSAHARFPEKDWLLLACDMPDLDAATIRKMIQAYCAKGPYEFYVYEEGLCDESNREGSFCESYQDGSRGKSFVQPFCSIYTSIGLAGASAFYREEDAADLSLRSLLKKGRTQKIPIDRIDAFKNYNSL